MLAVEHDGTSRPLDSLISETDIIVNAIYQDTSAPIHFVTKEEFSSLRSDSLIIDVSCDEGMGFFFAKPTSFKDPMFKVGTVDYYAVDHTPSYLWDSASRSISAAMIVYLETVMKGRESWQLKETIRQAINVDGGVVKKANVLAFQNRQPDYPHAPLK